MATKIGELSVLELHNHVCRSVLTSRQTINSDSTFYQICCRHCQIDSGGTKSPRPGGCPIKRPVNYYRRQKCCLIVRQQFMVYVGCVVEDLYASVVSEIFLKPLLSDWRIEHCHHHLYTNTL